MVIISRPGSLAPPGAEGGSSQIEKAPGAGAQTYLGARRQGSGHMMLDRVYPSERAPGCRGGAAAQSLTGGPEGAQVEFQEPAAGPSEHGRRR
jgi:hypothetical protein